MTMSHLTAVVCRSVANAPVAIIMMLVCVVADGGTPGADDDDDDGEDKKNKRVVMSLPQDLPVSQTDSPSDDTDAHYDIVVCSCLFKMFIYL